MTRYAVVDYPLVAYNGGGDPGRMNGPGYVGVVDLEGLGSDCEALWIWRGVMGSFIWRNSNTTSNYDPITVPIVIVPTGPEPWVE
jgi:hypothetical protein